MAVINRMADFAGDMAAWRRDLHGIPELDFDLFETAAYVAARLREIGVDEIHEGIARTGIVGIIRGRGAGRVIGLRADMDALPIAEVRDLPYRSRHAGRMHACGHDGHMAILLGAARYLAETRNFAGSVALIFQPSEEMSGGARVMCAEGLMARFGIESVFALHNKPGMALGRIGTRVGPVMWRPSTRTPLEEPRSSTMAPSSSTRRRACCRDTDADASLMSQSAPRPMVK